MSTLTRFFMILVLLVPAAVTAAGKPPPRDTVRVPGLLESARVTRDVDGIAHIRAANDHDLFFLQGYVHAEDRLFQMDTSRRQASGTLAELLGNAALPSDVQFRTLGLRRAAERSLPVQSARTRAALDAYAEGVNAWVASHPLPPEYGALELTGFEPWTALDSATVAKLIAFGLSFNLDDIDRTVALRSYEAAGAALGFDGTALFFEDLFRAAPFEPIATVPDASVPGPAGPPKRHRHRRHRHHDDHDDHDSAAAELGRRYMEQARQIPRLAAILDRDVPAGSNEWAVAGRLTRNRLPLMANDPHLALGAPSTFYPIHLRAGDINVFGSGFAGAPLVVLGHNRDIAWGATVNRMDVTDVYQEQLVPDPTSPSGFSSLFQGQPEHVIPIPELFRTNLVGNGVPDDLAVVPAGGDIPAATLIIPRRNLGPVIQLDQATGVALSVQYTGFSPTRELDALLAWNTARNLDDFIAGLQFFDFGSENFVYADRRGNIAYFTSAEMPVREDLQALTVNGAPPFFIRNGQGGNEWLPVQNPQPGQAVPFEILPFDEMPRIINPPAGYFVNANNDPIGNTLDNNVLNEVRPGGGIFYLNYDYSTGLRARSIDQRIRKVLTTGDRRMSFEEMQAIQADVGMFDAQVLAPHIVTALENADRPGADPLLAALGGNPAVREAVGRIAAWDYTAPTGIPEGYDGSDVDGQPGVPGEAEVANSVAATLYSVWRGQFVRNIIDSKLEPFGLPVPDNFRTMSALRNLLDNFDTNGGVGASGVDFFVIPGVTVPDPADRRDILILQSLADALGRLAGDPFAPAFGNSTDQNDYRWGLLHRIVFESVLGGPFDIPPAGGAFPPPLLARGLEGIPTDGGFGTVDASTHSVRGDSADGFMFRAGPVNRFVAEAGRGRHVRAESIWPGGTSGVLGSPFYVNMLPLWLTNDTVPLLTRNRDIRRNAATITRFKPAP